MKIVSMFTLVTMASILASNIALAEGKKLKEKLAGGTITITAEVKGCDDDAKKYCPGLDPKSQKAFMCMLAYEEKLSKKCKTGIQEAAMSLKMGAAAMDYSISACEADADKHCLDVKPGEGKIISCLKKNETKVSKACISALKETGFWNAGAK